MKKKSNFLSEFANAFLSSEIGFPFLVAILSFTMLYWAQSQVFVGLASAGILVLRKDDENLIKTMIASIAALGSFLYTIKLMLTHH